MLPFAPHTPPQTATPRRPRRGCCWVHFGGVSLWAYGLLSLQPLCAMPLEEEHQWGTESASEEAFLANPAQSESDKNVFSFWWSRRQQTITQTATPTGFDGVTQQTKGSWDSKAMWGRWSGPSGWSLGLMGSFRQESWSTQPDTNNDVTFDETRDTWGLKVALAWAITKEIRLGAALEAQQVTEKIERTAWDNTQQVHKALLTGGEAGLHVRTGKLGLGFVWQLAMAGKLKTEGDTLSVAKPSAWTLAAHYELTNEFRMGGMAQSWTYDKDAWLTPLTNADNITYPAKGHDLSNNLYPYFRYGVGLDWKLAPVVMLKLSFFSEDWAFVNKPSEETPGKDNFTEAKSMYRARAGINYTSANYRLWLGADTFTQNHLKTIFDNVNFSIKSTELGFFLALNSEY